MINRVWVSFFLLSFIACLYQSLFLHNIDIFTQMTNAIFSMAKTSVDIAISLIGIMCLWLGIFRIAEETHLVALISKGLSPLLTRLMPEVPANHPAFSAMTMNIAANMLGMDNAATPLGIKAMQSLQTLNPQPLVATNAQILFLVINTASVTLLPVTIFMFRAQAGAASPTDVFLPILLATTFSTFIGIAAVAVFQRINIFQPVILAYFLGLVACISALMLSLHQVSTEHLSQYSSAIANSLLVSFIVCVIVYGGFKKLNVYELFIEGAKEGFHTAITIIPYLVAMLVAIACLRTSGVIDLMINAFAQLIQPLGLPTDFIAALPTGIMKSFSGSGARALMLESYSVYGVDSLIGRMTSVMQGSSETTFYVLAVYFGSVGIRYGRHALICGLIADIAGVSSAIVFTYLFFGS